MNALCRWIQQRLIPRIEIICLHAVVSLFIISFLIKHRVGPRILGYTDAEFIFRSDPAHAKHLLFDMLQGTVFATHIPFTYLVQDRQDFIQQKRDIAHLVEEGLIQFPVVLKPNQGMRSYGAYLAQDSEHLYSILLNTRVDYLIQKYCPGSAELGISFVRNPDATTFHYIGIALKRPVFSQREIREYRLPQHFLFQDVSNYLTPEFAQWLLTLANTLHCNSFRLDASVDSLEDLHNGFSTLEVFDLNVGFHVIDQFLLDPQYSFREKYRLFKTKWEYALTHGLRSYHQRPYSLNEWALLKSYIAYGLLTRKMR